MRQSVSITGINTPIFNKAVENLLTIQNLFARHIGKQNIDVWRLSTFRNYQSVNFSNRYFTSRHDDPHGLTVPFSSGVNPNGKLSASRGSDLFHGEDNRVVYFEQLQDTTR